MASIAIVYHSGYGHTQRQAQAVAEGAGADARLIAIDAEGNLTDADWQALGAAGMRGRSSRAQMQQQWPCQCPLRQCRDWGWTTQALLQVCMGGSTCARCPTPLKKRSNPVQAPVLTLNAMLATRSVQAQAHSQLGWRRHLLLLAAR